MTADPYLLTHTAAIKIAPATWRDALSLNRLEKICFPMDSWPLLDLLAALTFPNMVRLKAVYRAQIIGFVLGDAHPSENCGWIASLGVHPDHRGKGIGAALLLKCERLLAAPRIRLSVRTSNEPAIRLYKQTGYQIVTTWPKYYRDGEDALVMEKRLGKFW